MTLVARIQGQVESPEQLLSILTTVRADNEASLRAAQIERCVTAGQFDYQKINLFRVRPRFRVFHFFFN